MLRRYALLFALSLLVIAFSSSFAFAAIFNVTTPGEFQSALTNAASNGDPDTINVAAGEYHLTATLTYVGAEDQPITISGAGSATTIINGLDSGMILNIDNNNLPYASAHVIIEGIAFRNAVTNSGIRVATDAADITVDNVEFLDNSNTGAVLFSGSGDVAVSASIFTGNSGNGSVGGLYVETSTGIISISGSTFSDNSGNLHGGVFAYSDGGNVIVTDCTFTGNTSGNSGAGITLVAGSSSSDIYVANSIFTDNIAPQDGGAIDASGQGGNMTFDSNLFSGNSGQEGGSIYARNYVSDGGVTSVTNSVFSGNTATIGSGGGIYIETVGDDVRVINNFVQGNTANYTGGGAYIDVSSGGGESLIVTNNTIVENVSETDEGGGLYIYASTSTVELYNNIIKGNTAAVSGDDIQIEDSAGTITTLDYNNYAVLNSYDNGTLTISNSVDVDPGFVDTSDADAANWNLHLASTSPMIDAGLTTAAGISASTKDIDGGDRIVGGTVDMGADEYVASPVVVTPPATGDSGGGCFIATAAYGSYMDSDVMVLREFRDEVLFKSKAGTALVEAYYAYSPPVADFIASHPALRVATRIALEPVVATVKNPGLFIAGIFAFTGLIAIRRRR
jgi:hypothetical protein